MPPSILEMAKDLVMAQIQAGHVSPDDIQHALQRIYASLTALKRKEESGAVGGVEGHGRAPAPVDWKTRSTRQTVTCLECGATCKQLSNRHLYIQRVTLHHVCLQPGPSFCMRNKQTGQALRLSEW